MKPYYFQNFLPQKPETMSMPAALHSVRRKYILEDNSLQNEEIVERNEQ